MENRELRRLIEELGGVPAAARAAGRTRQWLHNCLARGAITNAEAAALMLDAAGWSRDRLGAVVLVPAVGAHDEDPVDCNACAVLSDFAYDAARERRKL